MIKVYFKCDKCGCKEGNIIAFNLKTEIECVNCGEWEIVNEKTNLQRSEKYETYSIH